MYTQSMHYILHSIYSTLTDTDLVSQLFPASISPRLFVLPCQHTHAPHLLQPTLLPLQSSIYSKDIWSSNSKSIYLFDCFSARLSAPNCQRHTFDQKWTCLYSIDSAAESTTLSISRTLLLTLVF